MREIEQRYGVQADRTANLKDSEHIPSSFFQHKQFQCRAQSFHGIPKRSANYSDALYEIEQRLTIPLSV